MEAEGRKRLDRRWRLPGPWPSWGTPMHSGCLQRVCSEGPGALACFTIILLLNAPCVQLCAKDTVQTFSAGPGVGVRVELVQLRMQV